MLEVQGTIREPIEFTPGDSKTCPFSLAQQVVANLRRGSCHLTGFFIWIE